MSLFINIVAIYFAAGLASLLIFDRITHRIGRNLDRAAMDARLQIAASGHGASYLGSRIGKLLLVIVMWVFWPLVFFGAVMPKKEENTGSGENRGGDSA